MKAADANRVGAMLWQANFDNVAGGLSAAMRRETTGYAALPPYEFDALPGTPEPMAVLRLTSCFIYQTADDPDVWRRSEAQAFLERLRGAAEGKLMDGRDDLPWALGDGDADRNVFGTDAPPSEPDWSDPLRDDIHRRLMATGLPFVAAALGEWTSARAEYTDVRGQWLAREPQAPQMPAALVTLYVTEQTAISAFDAMLTVERTQYYRSHYNHMLIRSGRIVVRFWQPSGIPTLTRWIDILEAEFGPGEQRWAQRESIRTVSGAETLAAAVAVRQRTGPPGGEAVVARTPAALRRLIDLVDDPDLRDELAGIDLRKSTVILLTQIADPAVTGTGDFKTEGRTSTERADAGVLTLDAGDVRRWSGSVIIVDALPTVPTRLFLRNRIILPATARP